MFHDSVEYLKRKETPFSPPNVNHSSCHSILFKELRAVIPEELYEKSTLKGLAYVAQDSDAINVSLLYVACLRIDDIAHTLGSTHTWSCSVCKWTLWMLYWVAQSIAMAGCWCLGHEAGHGNLSYYRFVNDIVGFCFHSVSPVFFSHTKATHATHHKSVASLERDENYVPRTLSELGQESPLYVFAQMCIMELWGMQIYLTVNALGNPNDPPGSNKTDHRKIILSDIGVGAAISLLCRYGLSFGFSSLLKHYFIPYLLANHWTVMLTYLHHSDPTLPHHRDEKWSRIRGNLAAVDHPILGWVGRRYLHNLSDNQPQVTERIKQVLGEHYNDDSTPIFYALYRSFNECRYVDSDGDVVMYRNRSGKVARQLAVEKTDKMM
ncbi:hypothetical protein CPB85DRAFT_1376244 [Mucidula mucida]|nr:hypothetical protein CPB85DRAFT_1376244 [Mucidula mucida]